jgi:hypothetical protein
VDLHGVTINDEIALDKNEMDIESFGISRQRCRQIGCNNARQTTLPCSSPATIESPAPSNDGYSLWGYMPGWARAGRGYSRERRAVSC